MSGIKIRPTGIGRRQAMLGAATAGLVSGLAMPAIAQNKPIRMGWIAAVTGMFASNAQAQDWGFRMTVQDINEKGGLLGRPVEIVMRDSAADPSKAVSYAKELVYNENIDVLCGPINSGEALPTLGIVSGAKKLHLIGGSVEELINPVKYPLGFRNLNANGQWIKVAVKFMVEDLKKNRIAIINDNTGYGVLSRDKVTEFLTARGMKPVYTATVDPNKPDVTDELLKAKDAGADVVTEWSNATGFVARLVNARGEQNWNVPIVGHPTILQEQVAKLLGKRAYWDNVYGVGYRHEVVDAQGRLPENVQSFMDKHKDSIGPYMAAGLPAFLQGNAAVTIYAEGVRKAGDTDSFKVAAALESIPMINAPYGPFIYTAKDHTGFQDEGIVLVNANAQLPNGGYPPVKIV
ncbi:ABC transporter substrate-binding protein [Rhodopila sp.]|uniref:ABC transporter substrate-binding protein n=1 Tax=Rhodopila sp. TaxID=2480087 RepID=UPI002BD1F941|nr:ABC transporter substrate-binding protein [Rhodopila sp.]HVZ07482.1 ABC transporter substrate-binding protein [Rhodopila sp.]